MKKTQYKIIRELIENNKQNKDILNEGLISAVMGGIKSVGKFASKIMGKTQSVNTKKVEPTLSKPLIAKLLKSAKDRKAALLKLQKSPKKKDLTIPRIPGAMPSKMPSTITPEIQHYRPGLDGMKAVYFDILDYKFRRARFNVPSPDLWNKFFGWKFVDLMLKDFVDWEAYKDGTIDANGNQIRKAKNTAEKANWNYFTKAIASFRNNLYLAVASQQRINMMLGRLKMVKESVSLDHNLKCFDNIEVLMEENEILFLRYVDDLILNESEERLTKDK